MGFGNSGYDRDRSPTKWKGFTGIRRKRGRGKGVKTANFLDYKDVGTLRRFVNAHGKMFSRKRAQNSPKCQRIVEQAVKRARFMGILSYVN